MKGTIIKRILFILCAIVLMNVTTVKADNACQKDELARLKALAEKVEFDYEKKIDTLKTPGGKENEFISFNITANNLNDDLEVVIANNSYNYFTDDYIKFEKPKNGSKASVGPFLEGNKVNISIYAYVDNACSGKKLMTKTIKLPYYNKFYETEQCRTSNDYDYCLSIFDKVYCNAAADFEYCKQFTDKAITQDEFNKKIGELVRTYPTFYGYVSGSNTGNNNVLIISIAIGAVLLIGVSLFIIQRRKRKSKLI